MLACFDVHMYFEVYIYKDFMLIDDPNEAEPIGKPAKGHVTVVVVKSCKEVIRPTPHRLWTKYSPEPF